ncbi:MAG: tetratricopeptide repeat protein [Terrimicrobiaceae bacterium]
MVGPRERFARIKRILSVIWRIRLPFGPLAILALIAGFFLWRIAAASGVAEGERRAKAARTKESLALPAEFTQALDEALVTLRSGDPKAAAAQLRQLEAAQPKVASLTYLVAEAAMRNGDLDLAASKSAESIAKDERVSDALTLQAGLIAMKRALPGYQTMGDPRLGSELLLRQAILADAANPIACIRLGILLRYQNRTAEAEEMLRAGWARLNPVDSHVVVDATIALIRLEKTPDSELPAVTPDAGKGPAALFASAYTALRKNDFSRAVESLRLCQGMIPADLFASVIRDPAFRPYRTQAELAEFFRPRPGS